MADEVHAKRTNLQHEVDTDKQQNGPGGGGGAPLAATNDGEWTLAAWLDSLELAAPLLAALGPAVPEGRSPLDVLRDEVLTTRAKLDALLEAAQLAGFSSTVWAAVVRLRTERTANELHDKFTQDGVSLLEYSDLSTFFGGLEAKIGTPSPKIYQVRADQFPSRS